MLFLSALRRFEGVFLAGPSKVIGRWRPIIYLDKAVSGSVAPGVADSSRFGGFGIGRSSVAEGTIAVGTTVAAASQCFA
jgi:hypothetical protein